MTGRFIKACLAGAAALCPLSVAQAQDLASFYRGKTLEFLIGGSPGSVYDQWARLLGRHMGKQLPGNPSFVVRSMPGGGNLVATNFLYNNSPRDGTVVAMVSRDMPTQDALHASTVKFKSLEFGWLGSPELTNRVCVAGEKAHVKKTEDIFTTELVVGGTGAGSAVSTTPMLINQLLGAKFKLVEGYAGGPEVMLAMDRGEVEGICQTVSAIESTRPGWIAQGKLKVLFNMESTPVASFNAPSVHAIAKTDEQRQILSFYNSNVELGRPVLTTPGVPPERLAALRKAFDTMMKDAEFLDEAKRAGFAVHPLTGDQVTDVVKRIMSTPQSIIDKSVALVGKLGE